MFVTPPEGFLLVNVFPRLTLAQQAATGFGHLTPCGQSRSRKHFSSRLVRMRGSPWESEAIGDFPGANHQRKPECSSLVRGFRSQIRHQEKE